MKNVEGTNKSCLSKLSSSLRTLLIRCILSSQDRKSRAKYAELYRGLQDVPGCKLRPSELVIESVGDLSVLSQEAQCYLGMRMEKGFLARHAKGNTWRTIRYRLTYYLSQGDWAVG